MADDCFEMYTHMVENYPHSVPYAHGFLLFGWSAHCHGSIDLQLNQEVSHTATGQLKTTISSSGETI